MGSFSGFKITGANWPITNWLITDTGELLPRRYASSGQKYLFFGLFRANFPAHLVEDERGAT